MEREGVPAGGRPPRTVGRASHSRRGRLNGRGAAAMSWDGMQRTGRQMDTCGSFLRRTQRDAQKGGGDVRSEGERGQRCHNAAQAFGVRLNACCPVALPSHGGQRRATRDELKVPTVTRSRAGGRELIAHQRRESRGTGNRDRHLEAAFTPPHCRAQGGCGHPKRHLHRDGVVGGRRAFQSHRRRRSIPRVQSSCTVRTGAHSLRGWPKPLHHGTWHTVIKTGSA
eukprot:scaffold11494_cov31-Tisochrysis_lutea.AAC.2